LCGVSANQNREPAQELIRRWVRGQQGPDGVDEATNLRVTTTNPNAGGSKTARDCTEPGTCAAAIKDTTAP
jgi:hypothetical protein